MSSLRPVPRLPLSNFTQTLRFFRDPFSLVAEAQQACGDVFAVRVLGLGDWAFLCSPKLVREMFRAPTDTLAAGEVNASQLGFLLGLDTTFALDGDAHRERRRIIQPPLNGRRVLAHVDLMRETTLRTLEKWPLGEAVAFLPRAHRLSLDILVTAMFGAARPERIAELTDLFDRFATKGLRSPLIALPFLQLDLGPWSPWGRILGLSRAVKEGFSEEIARRLRDDELDPDADIVAAFARTPQPNGQLLSHATLLQEVLTLLFAGHETTGTILTWTLECLLAHPEVMERARAEVTSVVGDGEVRAEHVAELAYLAAVIDESIRFRPLAPMAGLRLVKKPFVAGDVEIPAGMIVTQCFPAMCQQTELFPEPDRFDPGHFLGKKFKPFDWNPFGGGTRMCTGRGFAEAELKVILAILLQRFDIRLAQKAVEPVRHGFFFGPSQGLRIALEPRRASH